MFRKNKNNLSLIIFILGISFMNSSSLDPKNKDFLKMYQFCPEDFDYFPEIDQKDVRK